MFGVNGISNLMSISEILHEMYRTLPLTDFL